MLLIFKSKSEKQGRKGTILKWLSWKENTLNIIMMLTMSAQAMTEIETGDLPVLRDTTGIVICMAGMKWADKATFKWEKLGEEMAENIRYFLKNIILQATLCRYPRPIMRTQASIDVLQNWEISKKGKISE